MTLKNSITAQTLGQKEYCRAIAEHDITICTGPSGSGKTMIAAGLAAEYLVGGKCDKILITRPCIEAGRHLGALPGILDEKFNPFIDPIYEYLVHFLGETKYKDFVKTKQIIVRPIEYLRGLTFHKTFLCLDEAQNCTYTQLKMFLTRIGEGSKIVINGDVTQSDLYHSGLESVLNKLRDIEEVSIIQLSNLDILRNGLIKKVLVALN